MIDNLNLSVCRVKVNCQIRKFKITKLQQQVMPTYCHIDSMDVIENDYRDRLDITYVLLNFPRYLSILLLQTGKTDSNALDIDAVYNLKLRKT
jgi:hypothetical protein